MIATIRRMAEKREKEWRGGRAEKKEMCFVGG